MEIYFHFQDKTWQVRDFESPDVLSENSTVPRTEIPTTSQKSRLRGDTDWMGG